MLAYVRTLHFNSAPNYDYLEGRLKAIAEREALDLNARDFDWIKVVKRKIAEKARMSEQLIAHRV